MKLFKKKVQQPVPNTNLVDCDTHGKLQNSIMLTQDGTLIGKYCFKCYNDFLQKNIKNLL